MRLETLRNLYVNQLREVYSAENQILAGLSKMESNAQNQQLRLAFQQHRSETQNQISRLDQIFNSLGESPKGETSKALTALIVEGQEIISASGDDDVIDAGMIGAAQKIEHYEIASYGTLIAYANLLRDQKAVQLLQASLNEEYAADRKLTAIAEGMVNAKAVEVMGEYSSSSSSSEGLISVPGVLMGAAAGVAIGMLLAPNSGMQTRRWIADNASTLLNQYGSQLGGLAETVRSTINQFSGQDQQTSTTGTTQRTTAKTRTTPTSSDPLTGGVREQYTTT